MMTAFSVLGLVSVFVLAYGFGKQKSLDNQSQASLRDSGFTGSSPLWSNGGSIWDRNKLPDFSYAGYLSSSGAPSANEVTPELPTVINVKSFKSKTGIPYGAKGDGVTDDTAAFKAAIETAENGAIFIPNGEYKLTDRLLIEKSNIEFVGESRTGSVLKFEKPLADVQKHYFANNPLIGGGSNMTVPHWQCFLEDGRGVTRIPGTRTRNTSVLMTPTNPYIVKLKSLIGNGITQSQFETYRDEACALGEMATNGSGLIWFGPPNSLELPPEQRAARVADKFNPSDPNKIVNINATAQRGTFSVRVPDKKSLKAGDYVVLKTSAPDYTSYLPIFHEVFGYDAVDFAIRDSWRQNPQYRDWFGFKSYLGDYAQKDHGRIGKLSGIDAALRIKSITQAADGSIWVNFFQPLPFKADAAWNPRLVLMSPQVRNGVRNLTVRMPATAPSSLHLEEKGFNAIAFRVVTNSWVKDVTIENADLGISVGVFSADNTIKNVKLTTARAPIRYNYKIRCEKPNLSADEAANCCWADEINPAGNPTNCKIAAGSTTVESDVGTRDKPYSGHYGIALGYGATRTLVQNIEFGASFAHDLSVSGMANRNVFADIWPTNGSTKLVFDHHSDKPYENLFTNIDLGSPPLQSSPIHVLSSIPYNGSGTEDSGPKSGARTTFWNLYDKNGTAVPEPKDYQQANPFWHIAHNSVPIQSSIQTTDPLIAKTSRFAQQFPDYNYAANVAPKNLFTDQLNRRKNAEGVENPTFQCRGYNLYRGSSTDISQRLYSSSTLVSTASITLRTAAVFKNTPGRAGSVEFCWAPYWNNVTNSPIDLSNGALFKCAPATTVTATNAGDYVASLVITPQQMLDQLPDVAKNLMKNADKPSLVTMVRLGDPKNTATVKRTCSANPGVNFGFGSEFSPAGSAASFCATPSNGIPCYQVITITPSGGQVGIDPPNDEGSPTPVPTATPRPTQSPTPIPSATPRPATQAEINFTKQLYYQLTGSTTPTGASSYPTNLQRVMRNDCKTAVKGVMWEPAFITRRSNYSNNDYIKMLFRAFVSRDPSAGELAGWNSYLTNRTYDRITMVDGLYRSSVVQNVCLRRTLYVPPGGTSTGQN